MIYYEVKTTGHIVSEYDLKLAYEICTGHTFNSERGNENYRRWANLCPIQRIPDSKITVEKLIEGNAFADAVVLYRKQNNCTLREARDACAELRANKET